MFKLKSIYCFIIGHKFNGYKIPLDDHGHDMQVMPNKFYCSRCKKLIDLYYY